MGVLFVINDVTQPSVLWARRMLEVLGDEALAPESAAGSRLTDSPKVHR